MVDGDPYPGVMDNQEWSVSEIANENCEGAETVKIAVGYFYVAGFELLKERLAEAEKVQLIIGRETDYQTKEELVKGLDKVDRNQKSENSIRQLYQLIQEDKVEVKIYTGSRFHPKLYLFEYPDDYPRDDRAVVGSSNLSPSGLKNNLELNVEQKSNLSVNYLSEWFDDLWESDNTEEFREDLIDVVESSKFGGTVQRTSRELDKVLSPFEATQLYIKRFFEREIDEGTLFRDISENFEDSTEMLAKFQKDAVRAARYTLDTYNGVIISDSVGLGKTYIAASLMQQLGRPDSKILIAAPNRLISKDGEEESSTWGSVLNNDDFDIKADVEMISMHKLSTLDQEEVQRFRDFDLIVLDEAHRLRNKNKRYANIQNIGRRDKKFILLTATPVQNSVEDVLNIMKVFADDEDFGVSLPEGKTVTDVFNDYQAEKNKDEPDVEKIEHLKETIQRVEREVIIARTRDYIEERYGETKIGGEKIKNPDRLPEKVSYLDSSESGEIKDIYRDIIKIIQGDDSEEDSKGLNLPYVGIQRYGTSSDEEFELQYRNAGALITVHLLKSLESSFRAFESSVKNLKRKISMVRDLASSEDYDKERLDYYFSQRDRTGLLEDISSSEIENAIGELDEGEKESLREDAESDIEALDKLESNAQDLLRPESVDKKLEKFREVIKGSYDSELESDEKKLVFTQFRDTAEYVFEELTDEDPKKFNIGSYEGLKVAHLSGELNDQKFNSIVNQFAPEARNEEVSEADQIDILISTDVLSVGQNLQDSRVVVNYDLHWNPMVMEQRIGRIDRITTRFEELPVYNFVPMENLEDVLELVGSIESKLEDITETMPKDSPILSSSEIEDAMTVLRKVDNEESEFEEKVEMKMTRYEKFKSDVQKFCQKNGIDTTDLQLIKAEEKSVSSKETDSNGHIAVAELEFVNGESDYYAVHITNIEESEAELDLETNITNLSVEEDDESKIFKLIESEMDDSQGNIESAKEVSEKLSAPGIWNNQILDFETGVPNKLYDLYEVCRDYQRNGDIEEVQEKAQEVADTLENEKIADFHINKLGNVWKFRNSRYNGENKEVIEAAYHEMNQFVTVPKRKADEIKVHLTESI